MAETPLSQQTESDLLDAAKSVRALCKRPVDLSPTDVGFLCVDPILAALGWNTRDPRQVRRLDGETMQIEEAGKSLTIRALAASADVPQKAPTMPDVAEWLVVTNGMTWNLYGAGDTEAPFRSATLDTPTTTKSSFPTLALLQKGSLKAESLSKAHAVSSIDEEVRSALSKHLSGSDALISAIRSELGQTDASDDAIRAAITQMNLRIGDAVISAEPAPQEAPASKPSAPAAKSSASKGSAKTAGKSAKSGAKSTPAKSAGSKASGAKGAATKSAAKAATPAPATSSTSEAPGDPGWPDQATHVMRRKKTVAYIKHDKKSDKATLLPGSVLTGAIGKALNPQQVQAREQSLEDGSLRPEGDMVVVTTPMEFDNPRLAATFAAGTLVKDISAWTAKNGRSMTPPKSSKSTTGKAAASSAKSGTDTPSEAASAPASDTAPEETTVPAE